MGVPQIITFIVGSVLLFLYIGSMFRKYENQGKELMLKELLEKGEIDAETYAKYLKDI